MPNLRNRFNGATRTCAWKPWKFASLVPASCVLQWSHAHVRVETGELMDLRTAGG